MSKQDGFVRDSRIFRVIEEHNTHNGLTVVEVSFGYIVQLPPFSQHHFVVPSEERRYYRKVESLTVVKGSGMAILGTGDDACHSPIGLGSEIETENLDDYVLKLQSEQDGLVLAIVCNKYDGDFRLVAGGGLEQIS